MQIVHRFGKGSFQLSGAAAQLWRLTEAQVLEFKKMIHSRLVFHMADHQSTHLMSFCPQFYLQSVLRVWTDRTNFIPVSMSEHQC